MAILRIHFLLELINLSAELGDEFFVMSIVAVQALDFCLGFFDAEIFAFGDAEVVEVELEFHGETGGKGC